MVTEGQYTQQLDRNEGRNPSNASKPFSLQTTVGAIRKPARQALQYALGFKSVDVQSHGSQCGDVAEHLGTPLLPRSAWSPKWKPLGALPSLWVALCPSSSHSAIALHSYSCSYFILTHGLLYPQAGPN